MELSEVIVNNSFNQFSALMGQFCITLTPNQLIHHFPLRKRREERRETLLLRPITQCCRQKWATNKCGSKYYIIIASQLC